MDRVRAGRNWLKRKIQPYYTVPQKERKLEIGPPTDFRRENITLGMDVDGNTVLIEQAREDAQRMHAATKIQNLPPSVLETASDNYVADVTRDLSSGKY